MYWLFCLFGPLYYFSHAQTRCYMSTYWLVCLVLMRCLLLLIRCVCICGVSLSIWLYHFHRARGRAYGRVGGSDGSCVFVAVKAWLA